MMPIKYGYSAGAPIGPRVGENLALVILPKISARKAEISAFLRCLKLGQVGRRVCVGSYGRCGISWDRPEKGVDPLDGLAG